MKRKLCGEIKIILLAFFFVVSCSSAFAVLSDANIYKRLNLPMLDQEKAVATLKSYRKNIEKNNGMGLAYGHYRGYSRNVEKWLAYKHLEADTGITTEWFRKVHRLLQFMAVSRNYLNVQKNLKKTDKPEYKKTEDNFRKARQMFAELLRHPEKVEPTKLNQLKQAKKIWLEQIKKQLKKRER